MRVLSLTMLVNSLFIVNGAETESLLLPHFVYLRHVMAQLIATYEIYTDVHVTFFFLGKTEAQILEYLQSDKPH